MNSPDDVRPLNLHWLNLTKNYGNLYYYVFRRKMFSGKLGLPNSEPELVTLFISMLEETRADFTMSFRELSETELGNIERPCPATHWALATLAKHSQYTLFLTLYKDKLNLHGNLEKYLVPLIIGKVKITYQAR